MEIKRCLFTFLLLIGANMFVSSFIWFSQVAYEPIIRIAGIGFLLIGIHCIKQYKSTNEGEVS
ncbi:hypothetical protein [Bacillus sp. FJAT-47783]|uniref:hypothetical protein n=1 Tax=Bacillus sp. FJAT-47783 TaxID=2922712 RepID=UPI001FACF288|nr:hypothetical protein [Bacillus sp. FJAT-47783]